MHPADPIHRLTAAAIAEVDPRAVEWTGAGIVAERVARWMADHLGWCTDPAWAAKFAHHCPVPDTTPEDFLQQRIPVGDGWALVGIRIRGQAIEHPFVDIVATTAEVPLAEAASAGLSAYAAFRPRVVRIRRGEVPPPPGWSVAPDQFFVAAPLDRIAAGAPGLFLVPVTDPQSAADFVERGVAQWGAQRPWLANHVTAATADELAGSDAFWIRAAGQTVGLIAAARRADREWGGWVIQEELVLPDHAGQGFAAAAQGHLAAHLQARDGDVLFGTIAAPNGPSLATAARAGRERVGAYWWMYPTSLPLDRFPPLRDVPRTTGPVP